MPFRYTHAPILALNGRHGNFPLVERFACDTDCPTVQSGLASRFRSQTHPLSPDLANEVIAVYERLRAAAPDAAIARTYDEALPYPPPCPDRNREATYQRIIRELECGGE